MPRRSWQDWITKLMGNAATEGHRQKGQAVGDRGKPATGPVGTSPMLKALMAGAVLPPEVQAGLEKYRSTLQLLQHRSQEAYQPGALEDALRTLASQPIRPSLGVAAHILQVLFEDCSDISFRSLLIGGTRPALLLFTEGMVNLDRLERGVLVPLTQWADPDAVPKEPDHLPLWLESVATAVSDTGVVEKVGDVVDAVLGGDSVLLIDGVGHGVKMATRGWKHRAIEEPVAETTIRGPREGFVETLQINTSMLRRRVKTPHLKIETTLIGRRTRTAVAMVYLKDVANPGIVEEMRRRLERLDIDGIVDAGQIEEFIQDQPTSIFPQINNTERPDRTAAGLLEGQVALLVDGSPTALLAPSTFWSFMHAAEDYYSNFWIGTFLLWLRYGLVIMSVAVPALYVAITTFHREMLPTTLLFTIAAAREGIPFPALFEMFMMELFFEALREAGVRLPRPVGQAISIVGALVIGEAAVQAGLASPPVVIVVAATGIASFSFPGFNLGISFRLLRFPLMLLAGALGLFGISLGLILILVHLSALRSFGVPYLQPITPMGRYGLKDVLLRAPYWLMGHRPSTMHPLNSKRQADWLRPGPDGGGDAR